MRGKGSGCGEGLESIMTSGEKRFLRLPTTTLGRASVLLFALFFVFVLLTTTVFDGVSASVGRFNLVGAVGFLIVLAAAVTGAIALARDGERSWAVWLSTVLPAVVLAFEVIPLIMPGE